MGLFIIVLKKDTIKKIYLSWPGIVKKELTSAAFIAGDVMRTIGWVENTKRSMKNPTSQGLQIVG